MKKHDVKKIIFEILLYSVLIFTAITFIFQSITLILLWIGYGIIVIPIMLILYPLSKQWQDVRQWMETKGQKNKKIIDRYVCNNDKYFGVTKTYSRNNPIIVVFFMVLFSSIIIFFLFYFEKDTRYILIMIVSAILLLYQIYLLVFETITISPEGINCKHWFKDYFYKWEDIKTAGFTLVHEAMPGFFADKNVYVTDKMLEKDIYGASKSYIRQGIIFFNYRPKMLHHMMAYYKGKIKNIEYVDSWRRYVERLNK